MRAVILPEYNANLIRAMRSLEVRPWDEPVVKNDQVLIKVDAASCNPSDIAFMRGMYNVRKPVPAIMGFEGTGTVISTGDSPHAKELLNRRVSFFTQENESGSWADVVMIHWQDCLIIDDNIPLEQAATFCINPFTAYALFQIVLNKGAKAFIQNAANGQVGEFLRSFARMNDIEVINIVRKQEHIQQLRDAGEKYCLDMSKEDFISDLNQIAGKIMPTVAFDAVSGEIAGSMLNAMPDHSEMVVYGGLSGKMIMDINPMDIIFKDKVVKGFNLMDWKAQTGRVRFQAITEELQSMVQAGKISTKIQAVFPLERVQEALNQYIRNMSAGKIILTTP